MTDQDAWQRRFGGIARLYGQDGLACLRAAHVAVIGVGGVGSWAAEALARSGVGRISLVDMDDICVSNTNRQAHTLSATIGLSKVAVMAERLRAINPEARIDEIEEFIDADNLASVLAERPDGIVDAIDSVRAKCALIAWCRDQHIPVLTTGGAGGRRDPARIVIADLSRTTQDALASKVRANLRKNYGFSRDPKRKFGVTCVYSTEPPLLPDACDGSLRLDCAGGYGASMCVTATFGLLVAARMIDQLLAQKSAGN